LSKNENLKQNEVDLSGYFKCRSSEVEFDSFGEMQKYVMTEDMQKGDIP
jgi:hypothetical protein